MSDANGSNPYALDQQRAVFLRSLNRKIPYTLVKLRAAWRRIRREHPESAHVVTAIENLDTLIAYLERVGWLTRITNNRFFLNVTEDGRPAALVRLGRHVSFFRLLNREAPYTMKDLYAAWRSIVQSHPDLEVVADLQEAEMDFVIYLARRGWLKRLDPDDGTRIVRVPDDGRNLSIPPPPPGLTGNS